MERYKNSELYKEKGIEFQVRVNHIDLAFIDAMDLTTIFGNLIDNAIAAMKTLNVTPIIEPIRGGTDGATLSYMGLPCPNLGTGGHNFHSVYEYICVEDIEKTTEILISIVRKFAKTKDQNLTLK